MYAHKKTLSSFLIHLQYISKSFCCDFLIEPFSSLRHPQLGRQKLPPPVVLDCAVLVHPRTTQAPLPALHSTTDAHGFFVMAKKARQRISYGTHAKLGSGLPAHRLHNPPPAQRDDSDRSRGGQVCAWYTTVSLSLICANSTTPLP